jgi:hypothetical protein
MGGIAMGIEDLERGALKLPRWILNEMDLGRRVSLPVKPVFDHLFLKPIAIHYSSIRCGMLKGKPSNLGKSDANGLEREYGPPGAPATAKHSMNR